MARDYPTDAHKTHAAYEELRRKIITASTGLQPEGPDPYRDTRDASYISGNAERYPCKMGGVDSEWADAFSPGDDHVYSHWSLGESDMQSLFVEMHENDYIGALDVAMCNLAAEG